MIKKTRVRFEIHNINSSSYQKFIEKRERVQIEDGIKRQILTLGWRMDMQIKNLPRNIILNLINIFSQKYIDIFVYIMTKSIWPK